MKHLFTILLTLTVAYSSWACDMCGCSAGGSYFGILPLYQKHFIGLRWQQRAFETHHSITSPLISKEQFQTVDLWGRFYPSRKWQIFAFLPYNYFQKTEDGLTQSFKGLGDASVIAQYALINTGDSVFHKLRHTLMIGGGLKMPLGKNDFKTTDGALANPNLQMGSGSWDFVASANYTIRYQKHGLFTDITTRFNTENTEGYRFGNRFSSTIKYFYWFDLAEGVLMPSIGAYGEYAQKDTENGKRQNVNAGLASFGSVGLDFYYKKWAISTLYQIPIHQNLGDGLVKAQNRLSVNLSMLF